MNFLFEGLIHGVNLLNVVGGQAFLIVVIAESGVNLVSLSCIVNNSSLAATRICPRLSRLAFHNPLHEQRRTLRLSALPQHTVKVHCL